MRAFVFPGQGGGAAEPAPEMVPGIRRVVGERIPDQVKIFARAAHDTDESRILEVRPDGVAGHWVAPLQRNADQADDAFLGGTASGCRAHNSP